VGYQDSELEENKTGRNCEKWLIMKKGLFWQEQLMLKMPGPKMVGAGMLDT
jgi:hypothetical protein